jgi:HD-like signal output (HDOD) protein
MSDTSVGTDHPATEADVTLAYLLRRMRSKSDFPALSASVARVQALSESETDSLQSLCDEVLKDVALTQKLLRVVNTAHYRRAGSDPISTISRAVSLIGVGGVRNLALSLMLLDHMQDQGHAHQLKQAFLHTVMAGTLASELATNSREAEEVFVGALFRRLGWLLVAFYLPDDADQIRQRGGEPGLASTADSARIVQQVLGVGLEALADHVGREWGLPADLLASMRSPGEAVPTHSLAGHPRRVHWLASLAQSASDAMLHTEPAQLGDVLRKLQRRYQVALGLAGEVLQEAAGRSRQRLTDLTRALSLSVPAASPAERLLDLYYVDAPNEGQGADATPGELADEVELSALTQEPADQVMDREAILTHGIQDITNTLVESFKLQTVLHMVLETIWRGLGARRVIFCLRDAKTNTLVGRLGLGEGADVLKAAFHIGLNVQPGQQPDLFAAVCHRNVDTLIADASVAAVVRLLPGWFQAHVQAPTFLVLPLWMKRPNQPDVVLGMIYVDQAEAGSLVLDERTLSLLRTLRNQVIMAFKQSAG